MGNIRECVYVDMNGAQESCWCKREGKNAGVKSLSKYEEEYGGRGAGLW